MTEWVLEHLKVIPSWRAGRVSPTTFNGDLKCVHIPAGAIRGGDAYWFRIGKGRTHWGVTLQQAIELAVACQEQENTTCAGLASRSS